MSNEKVLSIRLNSGTDILTLKETSLQIQEHVNGKQSRRDILLRNVINASFDNETQNVKVVYLYKRKKKLPFHVVELVGAVATEVEKALEWVDALLDAAYAGVKRLRSLLVFVNPFGGTKQGAAIFTNKVYPIFKAAGCELEVIHTTRQGHGLEVAKTLRLDHYDAIVTVSGDGLIHEVLNGLAHHAEAARALATPVVPIPTGSGNGLSLNLLGIEEGFDVCAAALGAIKGQPMKVDLFSFVQGGERSISFMSQSLGLMADVDIGTEHLRWMGDTRFMVGLIKGIAQYKRCPVKISFKLAEQDKHKMAEAVNIRTKELAELCKTPPISPSNSGYEVSPLDIPTAGLPPLQYLKEGEDGWVTFDEPILYVYAGKGPYVGRDFMAFPVSLPDDGLIDICVMPAGSRFDIIGGLDGAEKGVAYWNPKLFYVKAHAYRVQPTKKQQGYLSVDGEQFPFEDFQVEVHRGLGTLLSMYGHYVAPFEPRARPTKE